MCGDSGRVSVAAYLATEASAPSATTTTTILGFIDPKVASTHLRSVDGVHRLQSGVVIHLDETKPAGTAGFAIVDQTDGVHGAVLGEQLLDFVVGCGKGQIAHVQFLHGDLHGSLDRPRSGALPTTGRPNKVRSHE